LEETTYSTAATAANTQNNGNSNSNSLKGGEPHSNSGKLDTATARAAKVSGIDASCSHSAAAAAAVVISRKERLLWSSPDLPIWDDLTDLAVTGTGTES
jgi:hypothetical protein